MSFNIKNGDSSVGTINIGNVVMQLNNISDTLNGIGTGGGSISEVQITNLNNRIKTVSDSLQAFIIDSEKYIDETELSTKLQSIVNKLNNLVETNTFTTELNRMNTGILTINSEISNIKRDITTLTGLDLSEYQKKSTLETDVKAIINPQLTTLESNVKTSVETSVNSSISGTLSSLETKINGKIGSDIASSETKIKDEINISLSSTLSGYVTNTLYNQDKVTYSTLNGTNNFTGNNEFTNKVNFVSGIKVNGVDIDFNNLGGGSGTGGSSTYVLPESVVHLNKLNNFTIQPMVNGFSVLTSQDIQYMVKTNEVSNFTAIPQISGKNIATEEFVTQKIANIPTSSTPNIDLTNYIKKEDLDGYIVNSKFTLPEIVVTTDKVNNFTEIPKINNNNISTEKFVKDEIAKINIQGGGTGGVVEVPQEYKTKVDNLDTLVKSLQTQIQNISTSGTGGFTGINTSLFKEFQAKRTKLIKNNTDLADGVEVDSGTGNTRLFKINFDKPFTQTPIIMASVNTDSDSQKLTLITNTTGGSTTHFYFKTNYVSIDTSVSYLAFVPKSQEDIDKILKLEGTTINTGGGSGSVDTSNFVTKQKLEEVVATIPKIVMLTQSEYDLLPVKDEKTMYLIKEV